MAYDRFLIGPISTGLQTSLPAWQLTEDAFPTMDNAYVWRGRIRKRFGSTYMSGGGGVANFQEQFLTRFRILVGTTDAGGNLLGQLPAGVTFAIGENFSIGTVMFTVVATGFAGMLATTPTANTFDTTTGVFNFVGATPLTNVYWYPALPVMGFQNFEMGAINNQPLYGWDTRFVYVYGGSPAAWSYAGVYTPGFPSTAVPMWHGTDYQFFWVANYSTLIPTGSPAKVNPVMFVSNFNASVTSPSTTTDDPIWVYNPNLSPAWRPFYAVFLPNGAAPFVPAAPFLPFNPVPAVPYVVTALLIVPWKNRLLLLNTIENSGGPYNASTNTNYAQRCRFSAVASPFTVNAWYEPNQIDSAGNPAIGGSYIDAATEEQIQGCEFVKDQLVVYFERSTWLIRYTQNQEQPFVWERINSELGSESTYSTIGFDKNIFAIGNTGVHSCNGQNTVRIDEKIPDETFRIADANNGIDRVQGTRDFLPEMVYWSLPDSDTPWKWPNRVLVYNYRNNSWSYNDDSITAFGYFEQAAGLTWATATFLWASANFPWNSGVEQAQSRQVVGGNQEGFTFLIDADESTNAPVISITNMVISGGGITVTAIDHNLVDGDWIGIYNAQGITLTAVNYQVSVAISNKDQFVINDAGASGTYTGGGTFKRVSVIDIRSKQLNPYNTPGQSAGRNVYLARVDFAVQKTANGQITVDYYPSSTQSSMISGAVGSGAQFGTNVLETTPYPSVTLEQYQDLLWHPVYFQAEGTSIQMRIYLTPDQLSDPDITDSDLRIEAMIFNTEATSMEII